MPPSWPHPEALIADLQHCDWQRWFQDRRVPCPWPEIIRTSVASNTFRAFRNLPEPPSVVFRDWAGRILAPGSPDLVRFCSFDSCDAHDQWFYGLAASLRRHWRRRMGSAMPFGPSLKLPALLMKGACLSPEIPWRTLTRILWYVHVPLDSYTIQAVRHSIFDPGAAKLIGPIPASAGMGFVRDIHAYRAFQWTIRHLGVKAKVPPIALDILAWDAAHGSPATC
jgi:hypothetical protein